MGICCKGAKAGIVDRCTTEIHDVIVSLLHCVSGPNALSYFFSMIGFLQESPSALTKYVKEISLHFGNKKVGQFLQ